jgi:hypothetical protein
MATTTATMGLTLPSVNDTADIAVLNNNFQKIESLAMISHTKQIDDWNKAIYNGFYSSSASCINGPTAGSQYHGMMINYSSVLGNQFVFKTWADGVSEIWTRRYYNGEFGAWHPVLTDKNISTYAAPSGYGLGTYAQLLTADHNLNNPLPTGLYRWGSSVPVNAPSPIGYAVMLHIARTDGDSIQKVWHLGTHSGVQISCERYLSDNKGEWEWTNPPMQVGVEYRTTERWQGKAVYTMMVDCGAAANGKTTTPNIGTGTIFKYIGRTVGYALPMLHTGLTSTYMMYLYCDNDSVTIMCGSAMVGKQTYCQIWYYKD